MFPDTDFLAKVRKSREEMARFLSTEDKNDENITFAILRMSAVIIPLKTEHPIQRTARLICPSLCKEIYQPFYTFLSDHPLIRTDGLYNVGVRVSQVLLYRRIPQ